MKLYLRIKKNYLILISASFLIFATLGFASIPFYIDDKIIDLEKINDEIIYAQQNAYMEHKLGKFYSDLGALRRDHARIIYLMSHNQILDSLIVEGINRLNSDALFSALNAAILSKSIKETERDSIIRIMKNIDYLKLNYLYHYYEKKTQEGTLSLDKNLDLSKKNIIEMRTRKNIIWWVSILLQSFGMILGLIVVVKK